MNSTQEPTLPQLLQDLSRLSLPELHQEVQQTHRRLADGEWHLAACLLAAERQGLPRSLGCSSTVQYAVTRLEMDPQKAADLLRAAVVLENLPRISEAFRLGRLGWSKIRELKRVVCPETEEMWLKYALHHSAHEIQKQVTLSPQEFKRRAMAANRAASETRPAVAEISKPPGSAISVSGAEGASLTAPGAYPAGASEGPGPGDQAPRVAPGEHPLTEQGQALGTNPAPPPRGPDAVGLAGDRLPVPMPEPKVVRVVIEFSPDEYALWEQAERLVRQGHRGRMKRQAVAAEMARIVLDGATSRTRARHQVLVHRDPETGQSWYETGRGMLPADPEKLESQTAPEQSSTGKPAAESAGPRRSLRPARRGGRRSPIPAPVLKSLYARAGGRCESPGCGSTHYLQVHHRKPVSHGGTHDLASLALLCSGCHDVTHEGDFEERSDWREARARKRRKGVRRRLPAARASGGPSQAPAVGSDA